MSEISKQKAEGHQKPQNCKTVHSEKTLPQFFCGIVFWVNVRWVAGFPRTKFSFCVTSSSLASYIFLTCESGFAAFFLLTAFLYLQIYFMVCNLEKIRNRKSARCDINLPRFLTLIFFKISITWEQFFSSFLQKNIISQLHQVRAFPNLFCWVDAYCGVQKLRTKKTTDWFLERYHNTWNYLRKHQ